jgi:hypothetical protein
MTIEAGFGMFFYSMVCFTIGMTIVYYVIKDLK